MQTLRSEELLPIDSHLRQTALLTDQLQLLCFSHTFDSFFVLIINNDEYSSRCFGSRRSSILPSLIVTGGRISGEYDILKKIDSSLNYESKMQVSVGSFVKVTS